MVTPIHPTEKPVFYVVHPLDEAPEQKRSVQGLGCIRMSKSVRASLVTLRLYLILILILAFYHLAEVAGLFARHAVK